MKEKRPYAILIGLNSMQGLQAARILAAHDIPVIATCNDPAHPNAYTNACEQIIPTPGGGEEIMAFLCELGPTLNQKAVLFPCKDGTVQLISDHRDELAPWFHIALPERDALETLMDKLTFYQYAKANGLPVPETYILRSEADAIDASKMLSYPCILKPPYRTPEWSKNTSLKALKVESAEQFIKDYKKYSQWVDVMLGQRWIDGDETHLYSMNCYYDQNSAPLVTFVARKLRQWPPQTGQSSLGEACQDDTVLQESLRLFDGVNYKGLGYVEFKKDARTGEYFIVEPNIGRPTGRSAIAEGGDVALLYTMYCDLTGHPLPSNRTQDYGKAVKWVHLRRDLQSALFYFRKGELSISDWLTSMKGKKYYADFSWRDPRPFFIDIFRTAKLLLSAEERKKKGL